MCLLEFNRAAICTPRILVTHARSIFPLCILILTSLTILCFVLERMLYNVYFTDSIKARCSITNPVSSLHPHIIFGTHLEYFASYKHVGIISKQNWKTWLYHCRQIIYVEWDNKWSKDRSLWYTTIIHCADLIKYHVTYCILLVRQSRQWK